MSSISLGREDGVDIIWDYNLHEYRDHVCINTILSSVPKTMLNTLKGCKMLH